MQTGDDVRCARLHACQKVLQAVGSPPCLPQGNPEHLRSCAQAQETWYVMQVAAQRFQSFPATAAASLDAVVPSMSADETHNGVFPSAPVHAQPTGRNAAADARPAKRLARLPQRKSPSHVAQSRASA